MRGRERQHAGLACLLPATCPDSAWRRSGGAAVGDGDCAAQTPWLSADGRYCVFNSSATNLVGGDANAGEDTCLFDRMAVTTSRVSLDSSGLELPAGSARNLLISPDGRQIVFRTLSPAGAGDTNNLVDLYAVARK